MGNFIAEGLTWFQQQRQLHCTDDILIGLTIDTAVTIKATVVADDADSTQNRMVLQGQKFHFVVRRSDLVANNIKLQRGLRIWHSDDMYELAYDQKDVYEYNDPQKNDVVLKTVLVTDQNPIHPT